MSSDWNKKKNEWIHGPGQECNLTPDALSKIARMV